MELLQHRSDDAPAQQGTGDIAACKLVATRETQEDGALLEATIGAKVGADMMERYRGLADRRRDVTLKLKSLCAEAAQPAADPRQRTRLLGDAERMGAILTQLDDHFQS